MSINKQNIIILKVNIMQQRTNYCGLINETYLDKEVCIYGWVHKRRDLGGLLFFDIRDREGIVQCIIEPQNLCFNYALDVKHEYVVVINGVVKKRTNPNTNLTNGSIEIIVSDVKILNAAASIPILIDDQTTSEHSRMSHRIIDLRSKKMQHNLKLRHLVTKTVRRFLNDNGFIDIETPFLTSSTPGGAKDFLVPSATNKQHFYALPQSPQIFKQLLMVAGFDRYYQIVKCFRDEALRSDRQPEFTQIDIETSFLDEVAIRQIAENLTKEVFNHALNIQIDKIPIMTHFDALYYYGVDKPDLRFDLPFIDLTNILSQAEFKTFKNIANMNKVAINDNSKQNSVYFNYDKTKNINCGRIVALKIDNNITISRKELDEYNEFVKQYGVSGLCSIKINDINRITDNDSSGASSSVIKFLRSSELYAIIRETQAKNGDLILIIADASNIVNMSMNNLRNKIGTNKALINKKWALLWVIDFPLFEYNIDTGIYMAAHHPFTSPKDNHVDFIVNAPWQCLAKAYDLVLNGAEIGGGSVRIHDANVQAQIFTALNISDIDARAKFGFLLDNLQLGAPPHGGIAFGLDRMLAIFCDEPSIRDVIAFPKTISGQCLLTNAPSLIDAKTLLELGLKTN